MQAIIVALLEDKKILFKLEHLFGLSLTGESQKDLFKNLFMSHPWGSAPPIYSCRNALLHRPLAALDAMYRMSCSTTTPRLVFLDF